MGNEFAAALTDALENRFSTDSNEIAEVVERVEAGQEYEYTSHLELDSVESVVEGIENWSQGQGVTAGWNRWIGVGVPDTDTSHLTV